MFDSIAENIQVLGPAFAGIWILTVGLTLLRPHPLQADHVRRKLYGEL